MALYSEAREKAQAELGAVVGSDCQTSFKDCDALPCIAAVIKEILRWYVILPLGLTHRTVADDEINGYFKPAGTIILPNTWAIMHDPEVYGKPDEFNADRFMRDGRLNPSVRDPYAYLFGYGRRVCAGKAFADEMLYFTMASVLHLFTIESSFDGQGRPIHLEHRYEGAHSAILRIVGAR